MEMTNDHTAVLAAIRQATSLDDFLGLYQDSRYESCLGRLQCEQLGYDREDWAKRWAVALSNNARWAKQRNADRKVALALLYRLCDCWRPRRTGKGKPGDVATKNKNPASPTAPSCEPTITTEDIVHEFKDTKIKRILSVCLVMDRANAFYNMIDDGTNKRGMHWYAEQQAQGIDFVNRSHHTMNKRCLWLQDVTDLHLEECEFAKWMEPARKPRLQPLRSYKNLPPQRFAALVHTDVQSSTALWEALGQDMNQALEMHDRILRECVADYQGHVIKTEGDAFEVAFHEELDAVAFCLQVQLRLYKAKWSDAALRHPEACHSEEGKFRGLRVRTAVHAGPVEPERNPTSHRLEYNGATVDVVRTVEGMAHGGQILVTSAVWAVAGYHVDSKLESPQVLDLGIHDLAGQQLGVLQLVPSDLALDYKSFRRLSSDGSLMSGRRFEEAPIKQRTLSRSFHDAPYKANSVTMVFVYTDILSRVVPDPHTTKSALAVLIGEVALKLEEGYQCKDFMLAFSNPSNAIRFGLDLQQRLRKEPITGDNLSDLIKIGVHRGEFDTMGPDPFTGRADYYGRVVNRAARVASAAGPGQVVWGMLPDSSLPLLEDGFELTHVDDRTLKGLEEKMNLYQCSFSS